MKQTNEGYLCLFTVKNPSFPDYISRFPISLDSILSFLHLNL